MKRSTVAWIVAAAGFAFLLLLVFAVALVFSPRGGKPSFALAGRVGVVDVEGIILSADRFREMLAKFKSAPGVRDVVYAKDLGPLNDEVFAAYPDRQVYSSVYLPPAVR